MRIPSTGSFVLDISLASMIFIGGVLVLMKKESKWGLAIMALAGYWAYTITAPFYN